MYKCSYIFVPTQVPTSAGHTCPNLYWLQVKECVAAARKGEEYASSTKTITAQVGSVSVCHMAEQLHSMKGLPQEIQMSALSSRNYSLAVT